ncbi:MAG TPA: PQQ-binding-like beta-propeller repeat protein [Kofleriaceae bacterium]|nr:PQQ-binding-like beta-propeller repeat protein [Kofleriaceae bacterium]
MSARVRLTLALPCAGLALATGGWGAAGGVFVDRNGDGVRQADEPGVPGAVVALERRAFTVTDGDGRFALDGGQPGDLVWVRVPDGFRPGPAWAVVQPDDPLSIGLRPLTDDEARSPLTFVVGADTHVAADPADAWNPGDLADTFLQATDRPSPPRFFTIVGDLTQSNDAREFERLGRGLAATSVPWVPVPGNHDWYDEGLTYRSVFGPDDYSFDTGDVHVIVWDTNLDTDEQLAFFRDDLARVPASMRVVGLGHEPPSDEVADALAALGVDYLFTGHWHANRRVEHGALTEWGTQPMIMGGIDASPAGYRVVNLDGAVPIIEHHERLVRPQLDLVSPAAGTCVDPRGAPLVVAAALDGTTPTVEARVDCGGPAALTASGGWEFRGRLPALLPGPHTLELRATTASGRRTQTAIGVTACAAPQTTPAAGAWPQLGGGPGHLGARAEPLATPLAVRWSTSLGGALANGGPAVADGVVVVALADRARGDGASVVGLDLATGAVRWRHPTHAPVPSSPAIDGGLAVLAEQDGTIEAVDVATGAHRWSFALGAGLPSRATTLWAAPTISDGLVHVAVQDRLVALELATGHPRWKQEIAAPDPWLGSEAAITVTGGAALVALDRDLGVSSWDAATGAPRWANLSSATVAVNASPIVVGGIAYVANARGDLSALELATGNVLWSVPLTAGGFDWGYSITATPAYADGRLFVATQWSRMDAIDAATGAVRWQTAARPGPLELAHYRAAEAGFTASPVVTGDVVWIGHPDGTLVGHDVADGTVRFSMSLGAPIVGAAAPAGDYLVVGTYDGTVRALVPSPAPPPVEPARCAAWPDDDTRAAGCCESGPRRGAGDVLLVGLVAGLVLRRRRRRRQRGGGRLHRLRRYLAAR